MWRPQADTVWLLCRADVLAATLKRLSMFVLRARCKLVDASSELKILGMVGSEAVQALGHAAPGGAWQTAMAGDATVLRLPDVDGMPRLVWAGPLTTEFPGLPSLLIDAWRLLEVRSGVPMIGAATAEHFVPQMVNLELVNGVNFQKGCYPGQEVVARSQYRGTLKRRMFLFEAASPASAGQEVFHSGEPDQPAGMVVDAATLPSGGSAVLIEVKLDKLEGGSLHLGSTTGPVLQQSALPYDMPLLAS
jgi:folate-binding protein YgfZ